MPLVGRSRTTNVGLGGPLAVFALRYEVQNQASYTQAVNKTVQSQQVLTKTTKDSAIEQEKVAARLQDVQTRMASLVAEESRLTAATSASRAELSKLNTAYQAGTAQLTKLETKLLAAQKAKDPKKVGAYKGQITQLSKALSETKSKTDLASAAEIKQAERLAYVNSQIRIKRARLNELNHQLSQTAAKTNTVSTQTKTFGQSVRDALKRTFSSWDNFSNAVNKGAITVDRVTRSMTRGIRIANAISKAIRGKPFLDLSKSTDKATAAQNRNVQTSQRQAQAHSVLARALGGTDTKAGRLAFTIEALSDAISQTLGQLAANAIEGLVTNFINLGRAAFGTVSKFESAT